MPTLTLSSLVGTSRGNSQEMWDPRESGWLSWCSPLHSIANSVACKINPETLPALRWPRQPTSHAILIRGSKFSEPWPWYCTGCFLFNIQTYSEDCPMWWVGCLDLKPPQITAMLTRTPAPHYVFTYQPSTRTGLTCHWNARERCLDWHKNKLCPIKKL